MLFSNDNATLRERVEEYRNINDALKDELLALYRRKEK
jgi:hypothetical protein